MKQSHKFVPDYNNKIRGACIGVLSVSFVMCGISYQNYLQDENRYYVAETKKTVITSTITPVSVSDKIAHYFPRNAKIMLAIAKAESNLSMEAKGYNCYYKGTTVYSTRVKGAESKACLPTHRKYAWSVDCFVLQRNYIGKVCPSNVSLDEHLKEVAELSKKQGLQAWSSYNAGKHLQYLTSK